MSHVRRSSTAGASSGAEKARIECRASFSEARASIEKIIKRNPRDRLGDDVRKFLRGEAEAFAESERSRGFDSARIQQLIVLPLARRPLFNSPA